MRRTITPVILSGGAGTRLWPLSRELHPKQFLPLTGERTMLQQTALRLAGRPRMGAPIAVCNEAHRFLVAEQMRQIGVDTAAIVLEPVARGTAAAIALAALAVAEEDPLLLVLPADHYIRDPAALHAAIEVAATAADRGALVTFGIVPTRAETGYGYIRRAPGAGPAWPVQEFVEKPDAATAQAYVQSGQYFWNSGMFMFGAGRFLEELARHAPDIEAPCRGAWQQAARDMDFTRVDQARFAACRADSIDYAVMEKTADAAMVPLDAGWSDIGSWASMHEALPLDAHRNLVAGDVVAEDTSGCFLHAESRLLAVLGVTDHIVVETKDAVLVAPRERAQDIKRLVDRLRREGRPESSVHRQVYRPWGSYDSVDSGERFQVKRLTVKPGASMSLQMHYHRAEHWIVVSGTARITRGEETFVLHEDQSTYIPVGTQHRIENPGKIELHMIEVQSGSYLGEDDIVRFEDRYGR
ncbi:MAG: mannose-1-phosphate guanylyltransferase/mannose-6-phosphate isomerase [Gammaproteobacteria bacterium]